MKYYLFSLAIFVCASVFAQESVSPKQLIKERKEMSKLTAKAVDQKVTKLAKAAAKGFVKDGWKPAPGAMPIEAQLDNLYRKQAELKGDAPRYLTGSSQNTGSTYTAAKKAAMEFARQSIAEQIGAEVAELTNSKVGNSEESLDKAESLTQVVNESKSLVQQNIGQMPVVVEMYREKDGKVQVSLTVVYSTKLARVALMKAMQDADPEMKQQLEELTKDWNI